MKKLLLASVFLTIFSVSSVFGISIVAGECSRTTSVSNVDEVLKVMSFNIRYAKAPDGTNSWKHRRKAVAAMICDQHPAVFGLQEALTEQIRYLHRHCPGYQHVGVGREDGVHEGEHMAVFFDSSLFTLLDWHTYWLSDTPDVPSLGWDAACRRTATWVKLQRKSDGRCFYFVDTHLDHVGTAARRNGLSLIVDSIDAMNHEGYPMILVGDFNVEPENECLIPLNHRMQSARLTAEHSDTTPSFNGWGKRTECIDYIYHSGFTRCLDFRVVTQQYLHTPFVSDHYPVTAILEF